MSGPAKDFNKSAAVDCSPAAHERRMKLINGDDVIIGMEKSDMDRVKQAEAKCQAPAGTETPQPKKTEGTSPQ